VITAAFETSVSPGSVALFDGEKTHSVLLAEGRRHASDLLPTLQHLLAESGLAPLDLQTVCVGTGPGSYTGVRVAVATALGLAHSTGANLRAVPSVEALAFDAGQSGDSLSIALDARAGCWYFAAYRREDEFVFPLEAPCVLETSDLIQRLRAAQKGCIDSAVSDLAASKGIDTSRFRSSGGARATTILRLGMHALANEGAHAYSELEPLYLRPFPVRRHQGRSTSRAPS